MVLAGGSGTRLWPRSRSRLPKHLSPLAPDGRSLIRHAYDRATRLGGPVLVVTASDQADQVRSAIPELDSDRLLLEPAPRGTGPALAWAAWTARQIHPRAVMVSLHADHYMPDQEATTGALGGAAEWAANTELLITIGVQPTRPATGFGYVEAGEEVPRPRLLKDAPPLLRSRGFVEKPSAERAQQLISTGRHFWNTGLFAWKAELFLEELLLHAPEVAARVEDAVFSGAPGSAEFARAWGVIPSGAVDRLVLERSSKVAVLPAQVSWTDLGSFLDLYQSAIAAGEGDGSQNVLRGDALVIESERSYVDSGGGRMVVLLGVGDLAVVDTEEALMVCPLERVQEVSRVVAELRERGRSELL